ncbi:MAG TPA: hypothetical protein VMA75_05095 [Candidatus Paceibacterota bacterium]|nr:hypothetical protein [Candidatus Paceibacterota bacterium]
MIDVKKLIAGFLVFAIAAIGAGLSFSFFTRPSGTSNTGTAKQFAVVSSASDPSAVPTTAFVDTGSLQGNAAELLSQTDTSSTDAQASDPNNLTNILADSYIDELTAANPSGLTTDASGSISVTPPNMTVVTESIAANPAFQSLSVPDWDTEAQSEPIKVVTSSSQNALAQYGTSIASIYDKYFVSTGLQDSMQNQTEDPSDLSYIDSQVQGALSDTLALETPAPLLGLQQSLVKVLVYEENSLQLAENASNDPVKEAIIFQGEQTKYAAAVSALQQQIQNASSLGLSFNEATTSPNPLVAALFGIQTAHAQWLTFDASNFADWFQNFLKSTLLQILKNTLIALIQKKILTEIQGAHGIPKFVTDFATAMIQSHQAALLNTLHLEIAAAPPSQSAALGLLLNTPYQSPTAIARTASQLASPDSNVGLLAGGFTNFNDYMHLFGQGGNVWANAMTIQQDSAAAGANSQAATQLQTTAQQGWNPDQACSDGSDPNGVHFVCPSGSNPGDLVGVCEDAYGNDVDAESIPNGGKCANGQNPTVTNPGQVTGQTMSAGLQSGTQLITSANDITGLVEALTSALITQLATQAITAAVNAIPNPGVGGISATSISGGGTPPSTPIQCLPSTQTITISSSTGSAIANVSALGGAVDTACITAGNCPTTENSNGTPTYTWSAPGTVQGGAGATVLTGQSLTLTYVTDGTYTATAQASTDHSQNSCTITVTGP